MMKPSLGLVLFLGGAFLCLCPQAFAQAREEAAAVVPLQTTFFAPEDVHLLSGPFLTAQETDRAYLLRLDPNRLLAWMRQSSGLTPKAPHYAGWDEGLAGTVGHYLSACALMAQATGDPAVRQRVDYVVSEMASCQKANGDGGIYDSGGSKVWFAQLAAGNVQSQNTTPWYVTHKTLAGLRDAWLLCGNIQARDVLVNMANWSIAVTAKLSAAQWQQMLGPPGGMGEFGGPHEVLADVYAITGERKYLECAEKFKHEILFQPLSSGNTAVLNGQHANAEIPKFVGYERIYELTGDKAWHDAAQNFWTDVVTNRSWANGGNSQSEHFFDPAETQAKVEEICGPETCNTYNMLKLTQALFALEPSVPALDYYERALYNHILPSEAPGQGGFVYYTPLRPGHYRIYSRDYDAFWCCVGTGMENHARYGKMIYSHSGNGRLFVNLFIPSKLTWKDAGLTLRQETTFPQTSQTRLILTMKQPRKMTLTLRCPGWIAPGGQTFRINGKSVRTTAKPGSFVNLTRVWHSGDAVEVALPMQVRAEPLPHSTDYAAFFYGPILLAGPLGTEGLTREDFYGGGPFSTFGQLGQKSLPISHFPLLTGTPAQAVPQVKRVSGAALAFRVQGPSLPAGASLVPFYRLHFQRYAVYWRFQSSAQRAAALTLEANLLDRVKVGETASEADHNLRSELSQTGVAGEPFTHWRDAKGYFSYDLKVSPILPVTLRCAYWGGDTGRTFKILVDGQLLATQTLSGQQPNSLYYVTYSLPPKMTQNKEKVTVRFEPIPGNTAGGLFDCRTQRVRNPQRAD